ncbi:GNAT family N-acetyltransferase [Qipengyuania sp. MTN3-11]|uniref:GNAT family N-acetyltransferase n=1 Tax=Qipengyuania sp. MTN3-11 TaxID=3056557 RepID=UPI0036F3D8B6
MMAHDSLDRLMRVMEASFDPYWREAWTRAQVASSLSLSNTRALMIDCEGGDGTRTPSRVAGFVLARRAPGEEELLLIAVSPEFRNRGLGRRLLRQFNRSAKVLGAEKVFLEMRAGNPAETLYRSEGYEPIGRRRDYYTAVDGATFDAVTFAKSLIE